MKMKLFIVLALVATAYGAAVENCHMDRLTACGNPLAEFRKEMGQSFPTNEEQVKRLCEITFLSFSDKKIYNGRKIKYHFTCSSSGMKKAYDCAEEFQNKCMTPLQLETMGFLAEGALTVYNDFCKEGSDIRADYLKHAQCLDDSSKTEEAKNHYSYVEAALEDLSEKPPEKRLITACCGYQYLAIKGEEMGKANCGQEAVESFNKVVEMAVSSLPNVFCSGFEPGSARCNDVLPPAGTKPKGTLKNSHIAQTFASIYFPDLQ